jgi:hypothetical protein
MAALVAGADPQLGRQLVHRRFGIVEVTVTSSTTDEYIGWNVPTDIDLARMQLEELFK